jgi:5-formyltetrahydrofolate cyclo-ligase
LRQLVTARLRQIPIAQQKLQSIDVCRAIATLPAFKSARCIAGFLSLPNEIDISYLFEQIFAEKKRLFVPRIVGRGLMHMLEVHNLDEITNFESNSWGIREPPAGREPMAALNFDLIIVPGLAFDEDNRRLGRGAGFYDRFLHSIYQPPISHGGPSTASNTRTPFLVGVGFGEQRVDIVPCDAHDEPLHHCVLGPCSAAHHAAAGVGKEDDKRTNVSSKP